MTELTNEALAKRVDALNFAVEKSLRYHQRRRAAYDFRHKFVMFAIILLGSAAFGKVLGGMSSAEQWLGLMIAGIAALDLVAGFSHKARDHEVLHRGFSDMAVEIRRTIEKTEEDYGKWLAWRVRFEAEEPPIYWALEASCDNEVTAAWGRDETEGLVPLGWRHHIFMNWYRFDKTEFPPRKIPKSVFKPLISSSKTAASG
jgi:hypothetical protein